MSMILAAVLFQGGEWSELVGLAREVREIEWGGCRELHARLLAASDRVRSPESRAILDVLQDRLILEACEWALCAPSCAGTPASSRGDEVPEEFSGWGFDGALLRDMAGNGINRSLGNLVVSVKGHAPWLQRRLPILVKALDGGEPEPARLPASVSAAGRAAELMRSLSDEDIEVRDLAEGELRLMGEEIIPFLLKELERAAGPELRARLQELLDSM